jgi:hypothetical protein
MKRNVGAGTANNHCGKNWCGYAIASPAQLAELGVKAKLLATLLPTMVPHCRTHASRSCAPQQFTTRVAIITSTASFHPSKLGIAFPLLFALPPLPLPNHLS